MPPLRGWGFYAGSISTKMPRLRRYGRAGSPLSAELESGSATGAHGVTRPTRCHPDGRWQFRPFSPTLICHLPMKIVLAKIWRQADLATNWNDWDSKLTLAKFRRTLAAWRRTVPIIRGDPFKTPLQDCPPPAVVSCFYTPTDLQTRQFWL